MLEETIQAFQNALAIKGVRRVLWLFLVLMAVYIIFEAQTNFFEINAIAKRLDILEKASQQPISAEQIARIEHLKNCILLELETIQVKRTSPSKQFLSLALRFLKGAWVALPLFWLAVKLGWLILKHSKTEDAKVKGMMMYLGWLGLSVIAWFATMLGVNSVFWNSSQNIFISWIVFPICSAFALLGVVFWILLLRALLPDEAKSRQLLP